MSPVKDASRYPANWVEVSDAIRFDRAGGRCECTGQCGTRGHTRACALRNGDKRCVATHGLPNPRTGSRVVLTTAHLHDNPESDDPDDLLAMCQACHLAYDTRIHRTNRIASARGDLYPLFPEVP